MKAVALKTETVAANPLGKSSANLGFDANGRSSFGDLLADIGAETSATSATPVATKAPDVAPASAKAPAPANKVQGPAPVTETELPSDVASLVGRIMGAGSSSASTAEQADGVSTASRHDDAKATPDDDSSAPEPTNASATLLGLPTTLTPAIAAAPKTEATASEGPAVPDPTESVLKDAIGSGTTTGALVAAATGGMSASTDTGIIQLAEIAVSSQVAPAMITPLTRSLASTTESATVRAAKTADAARSLSSDTDVATADPGDASAAFGGDPIAGASKTASAVISGDAKVSTTIGITANGADLAAMVATTSQAQASPVDTVVEAVATMAAQMPDPTTTASSAIALARTMTLQITPGTSGTISIRMRLIGRGLDLKLSVSDPQTLGTLSRERDTLSAALHDRSYTLDNLVIQAGDASASGASHDTMQQSAGGAGSQPNAGSGAQSGPSSTGEDRASRQPVVDDDASSSRRASSAGGVFV